MRDYSKVSPKFWIGKTGRALRKKGPEAVIVGMYLMTSPTSNMLGLYYLSHGTIAHETGLGNEGAMKGLQCAIEAGFCAYDDDSEMVWVYEMASYQIAAKLKPDDKRCLGVQNDYNDLPENKHLRGFFEKYSLAFHMKEMRDCHSPSEGPREGLASQEQEQEQEHTSANAEEAGTAVPRPDVPNCPHQEIIGLYHELLPMGLQVRTWTGDRVKHLQARWREDKKRQSVEWWSKFFAYCAKSEFLTGLAPPQRDRDPFVVSLDWLVAPQNFAKVIDGKYHRSAT